MEQWERNDFEQAALKQSVSVLKKKKKSKSNEAKVNRMKWNFSLEMIADSFLNIFLNKNK